MAAEEEKRCTRYHAAFLSLPFVSSSLVGARVWSHPRPIDSVQTPLFSSRFICHFSIVFSIALIFKGAKLPDSFHRVQIAQVKLREFFSFKRKLFLECSFDLKSSICVGSMQKYFSMERITCHVFSTVVSSHVIVYLYFGSLFSSPRAIHLQNVLSQTRDIRFLFRKFCKFCFLV